MKKIVSFTSMVSYFSLILVGMAKHRYEQLKQQTQDELKHTLDEILEGDEKVSCM